MEWANQIGTLEIILVLVFGFLYFLYILKVKRASKSVRSSYSKVFIKTPLRCFYFTLLLIAFLGPLFGNQKKEVKAIGKDIYICVDLSQSMDAIDIQPSRIEKTKFELKKIINAFSSDRIGLIVYSSDAFIQCPLTFDQNALSMFIETLNTGLVSNSGTDFFPPLNMALQKHFSETTTKQTDQNAKIIVLTSDGEDFGDETESIAEKIKEKGIKLFTLGIGTEKGGKIPQGYRFKRDKKGNDVVTKLNSSSLKKLASLTGGKYYEVTDNKNEVSRMIYDINEIKGQLKATKKASSQANKYYFFLSIALVLIVFDFIVPIKMLRI